MTSASPTTTDDGIDFATSTSCAFLTGLEIREIEADPTLTVREIVAFRADPDPEPPSYSCIRCDRRTVNPGRKCPDCAHEASE